MVAAIQPVTIDTHTWLIDTGLVRRGHTACYLLHDGGELAFIDTGTSNNVPALLRILGELGFDAGQVRYILPTHVHLDHAGGAGSLLAACPNAVLATHHKGLPHLIDPEKLQHGALAVYGEAAFQRQFGLLEPAPEKRTRALQDGDSLSLGNRRLHFIDTPGHANHHGVYFDPANGNLFTGDTFGLSYREFDHHGKPWLLATTTPVAFDPDRWLESLDKILALQPRRACLTHFGVLDEPAHWAPQLRESIRQHAQIALHEEAADAAEGRIERLTQALKQWLVETARQHNPDLGSDQIETLLSGDLLLNAQGLEVWLARRARKRL